MSTPRVSSVTPAFMISILGALLGGGLAGSVFTWYTHRPQPAIVTYSIATTQTGADSALKSVVPNLQIKIGNEDVPVIYNHLIELNHVRGQYIDAAEVAIIFQPGVRVFGFRADSPSPVHSSTCRQSPATLICRVAPLNTGAKYQIDIATDSAAVPSVLTAARDMAVIPLDMFVLEESRSWRARVFSRDALPFVFLVVTLVMGLLGFRRVFRRITKEVTVVGRVFGTNGMPVVGATISVNLEVPKIAYDPVTTDGHGDFIVPRSVRKTQGFKGTVEVHHPGFGDVELPIQSPIVFVHLNEPPKLVQNEK